MLRFISSLIKTLELDSFQAGNRRSSEKWGQGAKYQDAVQKKVRNRGRCRAIQEMEGEIDCRRYRSNHGEIPGIDSSFSSFSPTVAFSAVRMLVALTVDPRFSVESYDLSDAFLGTRSERQGSICPSTS